jgi:predicted ATPase/transcriptional regulator with XRE-family HTH domain
VRTVGAKPSGGARREGRWAVAEPALSFAALLRQLRAEARLTQEELAEAAGLSPRSVSDLERGISRTARKDTALLLADALDLAGPARVLFVAAARGKAPAAEVQAAQQGLPWPARHNLPAPLTSFVGREQDLARLDGLLGQARLVTLTGTGGAGKTRLALEFASGVVGRFPDGAWLADLASVTSPGLVAVQVMEALGVRQAGEVPVIEALRYRLHSAELLLVLDNCEHLLDACAELASALLSCSPGLRVVATSREPLGVPGEVTYKVVPLAAPPESADSQLTAAAPAVQLFLERASAARGGAERAGDVPLGVAGRICRALDGLPLAIELAAARISTLSAGEIEAHLADRFAFLAYRRPVPDPRHQALQAAMDWSYDLLSPEERRVFSELSVFAGSFGLAQAAAVCSEGDQVAALEVVDSLASKSLVTAEPAEDGTRYRLLDTVRQYAASHLARAGQTGTTCRRHAVTFLRLAEQERGLAALSDDIDNFRAALGWSLPAGNQIGLQLACALGGFWLARGLLQEGRDWLERALSQHPAEASLKASLLRHLAAILYESGDLDYAEAALAEGARAAAAAGLPAAAARIAVLLAEVRNALGHEDISNALEDCEAAAATLESGKDFDGAAEAWISAGKMRFYLGDSPADADAFERAAAFARRSGNRFAEMLASQWLALTFLMLRAPAEVAIRRIEQLLDAASGEPWAEAAILMPLSVQYAYTGRFADARQAFARSQSTFTELGAKLEWAMGATHAGGDIEAIAGNLAAAEDQLKAGNDMLEAMGEHGFRATVVAKLADLAYAQERFGEAEQLTQQAKQAAAPDDIDAQARWRATKAKLLAHHGQFSTAKQLVDQAEALIAPTSWAVLQAEILVAKAHVAQLAGSYHEAASHLRAAQGIYQDRQALALAATAEAALTALTGQQSR